MSSTIVPVRLVLDPSRPDVRRLVLVCADTSTDTVGDLACALGADRHDLWIDGRRVDVDVTLDAGALVAGSVVSLDGSDRTPDAVEHHRPGPWLHVVAGPDAGIAVPLASGTTVVGSRPGDRGVAVADRSLASLHAAVTSGPDGVVCIPVADRWTPPCSLPPGTPVRLADSVVMVTGPGASADAPAEVHEARRTLRRPPRRAPARIEVPTTPAVEPTPDRDPAVEQAVPTTALVGAGVGVLLAVVLRQPLLALMGATGAVVSVASWAVARRSARRRRRTAQRETVARTVARADDVARRRAEAAVRRRLEVVDLAEALRRVHHGDVRLWERRPGHRDVWRVVLGSGESTWSIAGSPDTVSVSTEVLQAVPVEADLSPGSVVGVAGSRSEIRAFARSLLLQMVIGVGPADLAVRVVTDDPAAWAFVDWLPHATAIAECTLTIVDTRTATSVSAADDEVIVVLAPSTTTLPASCTAVATVRGVDLRWLASTDEALPVPVHAALLTEVRAADAAARLAGWRDPEAADAEVGPTALADLVPTSVEAIRRRWAEIGVDPRPVTPLGVALGGCHGPSSGRGTVDVDLVRDGPHVLVAGTTGAGKSELLRTLVVGLAACSPPDLLSFVLVDYKGGAAFDACARLPHVVGLVTDLDDGAAERALRSLHAELRRREHLLRSVGAADLDTYRRVADAPPLARLVVAVDEFATVAQDLPDFIGSLVGVAQRGRSLGVHLVLATQRPGAAVTDDIRANTNLRIALRVTSVSESVDVVGDAVAAGFDRSRPGRAAVRRGAGDLVTLQVASSGHRPVQGRSVLRVVAASSPADREALALRSTDDGLSALVDAVTAAAVDRRPPDRPWRPPLPVVLSADEVLAPGDMGVLDDPDSQAYRSLRWEPGSGHLVVVGARGAGRTSALLTIAGVLAAAPSPVRTIVVDADGDERWTGLIDDGVVDDVIRVDDVERLARVLTTLDTRDGEAVVVVADGWPSIRAAVADLGVEVVDALDRLVVDGPARGVTLAVASPDPGALSAALLGRCAQRWVLPLADPLDGIVLGVSPRSVAARAVVPGRVLVVPDGLQGQVADPSTVPRPALQTPRRRVPRLPTEVRRCDLPLPSARGGVVRLPIGLGARRVEPVHLDLAPGDHVLVAGGARSGRTSTLHLIAELWCAATGREDVVVLRGRGGAPGDRWPCAHDGADVAARVDAGAGLVIVDDADRFDDPSGALARVVADGRAHVVVAGRSDVLRGAFAHWTAPLRRRRTGLLLTPSTPEDGELLGLVLPRHRPTLSLPGRGWLVVDGVPVDQVQVCRPDGV